MRLLPAIWLAAAIAIPGTAQIAADEPITVSAEHPRLLLRPARLRLLRRERERTSARWQQLQLLVKGKAPLPEKAFAYALYYQVTGEKNYADQAVTIALEASTDLRQVAIVFDWCQDAMTVPQKRDLTARLQRGITETANTETVASVRARALAAIALFDHVPQAPQRELERIVRTWWGKKIVPALKSGRSVIARDDAYPLWEMFHAIRDTVNIDLREAAPRFFKDFPIEHLISYYPAAYEGPDTDYYIGAEKKPTEPDLELAVLSRAAELAMVALDVNAAETQVLQGWLMHDRFILKGPFGSPYEFLWANPYQPGLSYYHVPLVYHNPDFGRLFIRSSWEDSAKWFGYFDGVIQVFENGQLGTVSPAQTTPPLEMKEAVVCFAQKERKFTVKLDEEDAVFLIGLAPRHTYMVEIDDEESVDMESDIGGILVLDPPHGKSIGIRIADAGEAPPATTRQ